MKMFETNAGLLTNPLTRRCKMQRSSLFHNQWSHNSWFFWSTIGDSSQGPSARTHDIHGYVNVKEVGGRRQERQHRQQGLGVHHQRAAVAVAALRRDHRIIRQFPAVPRKTDRIGWSDNGSKNCCKVFR